MDILKIVLCEPSLLVRCFYLGCSVAILTARLVPFLRNRYLAYGARAPPQASGSARQLASSCAARTPTMFDFVAVMNVPHSWFTHFYLVSIMSTIFWALKVFTWHQSESMSSLHVVSKPTLQSSQSVTLCTMMLFLHGLRRLYECLVVMKPSASTMWIGHYMFGLAFYLVTNVAIWIESWDGSQVEGTLSIETLITSCSPCKWIGTLLFVLASLVQHMVHRQLASLKKYTLPHGVLFNFLVAPHYTAECVIYLGIALVGAPSGQTFNRTLVCAVVLCIVNLGITAEGTKAWMLTKFREQSRDILGRYCLLPGVW